MKSLIAVFLVTWASSAIAGSIVNEQFSGTQIFQSPQGPLFRSKVLAQGERIRIETSIGSDSLARPQVILLQLDKKAVYFLDVDAKIAMRANLSHPLPLLAPGYLPLAILFQKEVAGRELVWTRLDDENIEGKTYEKYGVRGLPQMEAVVYLVPSTRLPFRVDIQLVGQPSKLITHANWVDLGQTAQGEELFTVPLGFQVEDAPMDLR